MIKYNKKVIVFIKFKSLLISNHHTPPNKMIKVIYNHYFSYVIINPLLDYFSITKVFVVFKYNKMCHKQCLWVISLF